MIAVHQDPSQCLISNRAQRARHVLGRDGSGLGFSFFFNFFFKLSTNTPCDLTQACVFRSGREQKVLPPACKQHMDVWNAGLSIDVRVDGVIPSAELWGKSHPGLGTQQVCIWHHFWAAQCWPGTFAGYFQDSSSSCAVTTPSVQNFLAKGLQML